MKIASFTLMTLMFASHVANAITFCTNALGPKTKVGARWMLLHRNYCPSTTDKIRDMKNFKYKLVKKSKDSCVYNAPKSKETGNVLVCKTNLNSKQAKELILASGVKSPYLSRYVRPKRAIPTDLIDIHEGEKDEEIQMHSSARPGSSEGMIEMDEMPDENDPSMDEFMGRRSSTEGMSGLDNGKVVGQEAEAEGLR